jgi:tetratricopeptide (TPR) repeat protein
LLTSKGTGALMAAWNCVYRVRQRMIPRACFQGVCAVALLLYAGLAPASPGPDGPPLYGAARGPLNENALEEAYQCILDAGAKNYTPFSLLLIHESRSALARSDSGRAMLLGEYAADISPDLPPAHLAAARARYGASRLRVQELVFGYAGAWLKKMRHGEALFFMLAIGLCAVLGAFLLTLVLVSSVGLCKYARLMFHDVRHAVPGAVPNVALGGGCVLVLLMPVVCGMSVFWLCPYWLVLLYGYHSAAERRCLSGILTAFAVVIPLVAAGIAFSLFVLQSDQLRVLWQAQYDYCDERCVERGEQFLAERPDDVEMLFALGLVHKKQQNYRTSKRYFEMAALRTPGDHRILTNLGNVNLALQQWDQAVERYRAAIALAPDDAAGAHFNYARAFQQKFMFKEAEQQFVRAKRLDHKRIDRYLEIYSENYNRLLIDEVLPKTALLKRAGRLFAGQTAAVDEVYGMFFGGVPVAFAPLIVLFVLAATVYAARQQTFRVARACSLCGKALCKRCQRVITSEVLCTQCHNFLQKQEKLGHSLRAEKVARIMRHVQRISGAGFLLSWTVPGAGHIWKGKPVTGAAMVFFFVFLLLTGVLPWVFEGPWGGRMSARTEWTALLGAVLVGYWFSAAVAAGRVRSREIEDNVALKNITAGF